MSLITRYRARLPRRAGLLFLLTSVILTATALLLSSSVLAQSDAPALIAVSSSTAGFLLLLPLGLILLLASTLPQAEEEAAQAASTAFFVWGVAVLAYFAVGFAFQFGGLAVNNRHPDFAELYWNWSPLDPSFGPNWGFIGLRGFALLGPAATPGVFDLFLRHVALLGVVTSVPTFLLYRRTPAWVQIGFGLLAGSLLYPLVGNWIWSAGWLANLGLTQELGHGFVDAGVATPFVLAGLVALAARLVFKPIENPLSLWERVGVRANHSPPPETFTPMPPAYLPLLSFLGLGLVLWSWAFIANGQHIPTATELSLPRAALNGVLAAFGGAVSAGLYARFTTARWDSLMIVRGGVVGLVLLSASATFVAPWLALAAGLVAGLLLPPALYLVDHVLKLTDHTGSIASFAVLGWLAWLMVAFFADGQSGVGWNRVGEASYLGVSGQGVSGLLVAGGFAVDWPGQLNAQLLGLVAITLWGFGLAFGYFKAVAWWLGRGQSTPSEPNESSESNEISQTEDPEPNESLSEENNATEDEATDLRATSE